MSQGYGKFNAREHKPENGGIGFHPPGIFNATITSAKIVPTRSNDGAFYEITFKTSQGEAQNRHNLWNSNPKTVEIAQGELSALCHCINFWDIDFDTNPAVLVGAPLMIEVGQQMVPSDPNNRQSTKVLSPNMTEVKRLFSAAGINPVKPNDPPVVEVLKELIPSAGPTAPAATPAQEAHATGTAASAPWNAGAPAAAPAAPAAPPAGVVAPPATPAAPAPTVATNVPPPVAPPAAPAAAGGPPWLAKP